MKNTNITLGMKNNSTGWPTYGDIHGTETYVKYNLFEKHIWIDELKVAERYRRRGIGKKLYQHILDVVSKEPREIQIVLPKNDPDAEAFLSRMLVLQGYPPIKLSPHTPHGKIIGTLIKTYNYPSTGTYSLSDIIYNMQRKYIKERTLNLQRMQLELNEELRSLDIDPENLGHEIMHRDANLKLGSTTGL